MATNRATEINLVKTLLGAGMLALPFAFKSQGFVLATLSIVVGYATALSGVMLLAYASGFVPAGQSSFFEVAKITYPSLAVWFDVAIGLKCFGVCISYLVIIGNLMPGVTAFFGYETSEMFWLIVAIIIVTPISFQKSLESLKTASMIALSSVVYLVVLVFVHYVRGDTVEQRGEISLWKPQSASSFISSVPLVVFAFTLAQNMFSAINELDDKSIGNIKKVSSKAIGIAAVIYFVLGALGYLSFGDNVSDNVISMYAPSVSSTLGRFAIVILVLFSYPLMCHPSRASITNVLNAVRDSLKKRGTDVPTDTSPLLNAAEIPEKPDEAAVHAIVTALILVLSFVLANTLNSLELILSFVGATGATSVSFIFPGIFAYSLAGTDRYNSLIDLDSNQKKRVRQVSLLLITYGVVVAVLAVGVNISRIVNGN